MQDGDPALLLDRIVPGPPARVPAGERIYAIGDIHGRLDLLTALIGRIRRDNADRVPARVRLILLGDIIDRGPDSAALIDRCMAATGRFGDFSVLRGNHEAMMVHAVKGNLAAFSLWLKQGGDSALASWGVPEDAIGGKPLLDLMRTARRRIAPEILAWIEARPLTLRLGDYLFVHAGIRPGRALAAQSADDLMWIRDDFLQSEADHSFVVVHGHSIRDEGVEFRANRIGIDTGAYRSHILTALALEGEDRWIVATDASDSADDDLGREAIEADLLALFGGETATPPAPPVEAGKRGRGAALIAAGALIGCGALAAVLWPHGPPPRPPSAKVAAERSAATNVALGPAGLPARGAPAAGGVDAPLNIGAAATARPQPRDRGGDGDIADPARAAMMAPVRSADRAPKRERMVAAARTNPFVAPPSRRVAREGSGDAADTAPAARAARMDSAPQPARPDAAAPARVETATMGAGGAPDNRAIRPPAEPVASPALAEATAPAPVKAKTDPNRAIDAIRLLRRQ